MHKIGPDVWKEISYQVPIVVDCHGLTPLDYSLAKSDHINYDEDLSIFEE